MATTELLESKVVILEEEPSIPAIAALPSAVTLCLGVTQRGPIGDPVLLTSFEEYVKTFGGFTENSQVAIAVHGYFLNGGSYMWVSRTCHYTDITDATTYEATEGSVTLQTSGTADSPATVTGTETETFNLETGQHIDIDVGSGPVVVTFTGTQGQITDTAGYPIAALAGGETMGITVAGSAGGAEQTVTAVGGETTAAQIAALINGQVAGISAVESGGQVQITTDIKGADASVQVTTAGTLNAILGFSTAASVGGGNVGDIDNVTGAEVESVIEGTVGLTGNLDVTVNGTGTLTLTTVAVGAAASVQVAATTTADFGFDNLVHNGADATPEDTLVCAGKTPYDNSSVQVAIADASSGDTSKFNLQVLDGGVVKEVFPNLTMDTTSTYYVETIVNHTTLGSKYIEVTDQGLVYSALLKRPVNGTSANMVGGDDGLVGLADIDYTGSQAGPTGLYAFDAINTGRILIVPGAVSSAVHKAMMDYAEVTRSGNMFCVLDSPSQYTASSLISWLSSEGLGEYSEYGAMYWPWIKIINPSKSVYGSGDTIAVPPSGFIAGLYANNDKKIGGIYESPAGIGSGFGVIRGCVGVEDDPSGRSTHEVEDNRKRGLVYPERINPITKLPGTTWHIDGGRTLKSTSNFPNIGERRGVIYIKTAIQEGLIIMKHRFNNDENRLKAERIIRQFLVGEMRKNAFRSTNPETAFFVDVGDGLNPPSEQFAGRMNIRIGLATQKPAEFIVVTITQDTRALEEELATA